MKTKIEYANGTGTFLLDPLEKKVWVFMSEEHPDKDKINYNYYYTSRTGRSASGWLETEKQLFPIGSYRTDCREIFPGKPIGGWYFLLPHTNGKTSNQLILAVKYFPEKENLFFIMDIGWCGGNGEYFLQKDIWGNLTRWGNYDEVDLERETSGRYRMYEEKKYINPLTGQHYRIIFRSGFKNTKSIINACYPEFLDKFDSEELKSFMGGILHFQSLEGNLYKISPLGEAIKKWEGIKDTTELPDGLYFIQKQVYQKEGSFWWTKRWDYDTKREVIYSVIERKIRGKFYEYEKNYNPLEFFEKGLDTIKKEMSSLLRKKVLVDIETLRFENITQEELLKLLREHQEEYLTVQDSLNTGNCETVTRNWCKRVLKEYRIDAILIRCILEEENLTEILNDKDFQKVILHKFLKKGQVGEKSWHIGEE